MSFQVLRQRHQALSQNESLSPLLSKEEIPSNTLCDRIEAFVRKKIISSFYSGYVAHPPAIAEQRRHELFEKYHAEEIECRNDRNEPIDALVLKSQAISRTGNVLVVCLNTTYQDRHPKHWKIFLENGTDVALWNPTKLGPKAYSQDLRQVLSAIRKQNQVLVVTGHCMATDPAISAVSELNDPNIHLIIDRGHGNAPDLVRSMTLWGRLSLVRRIVDEECDCRGVEKIQDIQGKILFIFPGKIDQIMNYGTHKSFTQDLQNRREANYDRVTLEGGDHWSRWDYKTYSQVLIFLSQVGVVASQESFEVDPVLYPPVPPLSWFQEKLLPLKLKCKATIAQF